MDEERNLHPKRTEEQGVRKDMVYSPGSETETRRKQEEPVPDRVAADVDPARIRAVPGTGGPDDAGDVDPGEINRDGGD